MFLKENWFINIFSLFRYNMSAKIEGAAVVSSTEAGGGGVAAEPPVVESLTSAVLAECDAAGVSIAVIDASNESETKRHITSTSSGVRGGAENDDNAIALADGGVGGGAAVAASASHADCNKGVMSQSQVDELLASKSIMATYSGGSRISNQSLFVRVGDGSAGGGCAFGDTADGGCNFRCAHVSAVANPLYVAGTIWGCYSIGYREFPRLVGDMRVLAICRYENAKRFAFVVHHERGPLSEVRFDSAAHRSQVLASVADKYTANDAVLLEQYFKVHAAYLGAEDAGEASILDRENSKRARTKPERLNLSHSEGERVTKRRLTTVNVASSRDMPAKGARGSGGSSARRSAKKAPGAVVEMSVPPSCAFSSANCSRTLQSGNAELLSALPPTPALAADGAHWNPSFVQSGVPHVSFGMPYTPVGASFTHLTPHAAQAGGLPRDAREMMMKLEAELRSHRISTAERQHQEMVAFYNRMINFLM